MTIDEQIEILKAVKEGKKIEVSLDDGKTWSPKDGHAFYFSVCLYRIVREPRRFIIAREPGMKQLIALPYGRQVPEDYMIICLAIEEPTITPKAAADFGTTVAKQMVENR